LFPELQWTATLSFLCLIVLSSMITIAPGNLGVFEIVGILTLEAYGVTSDIAIVAVTSLHVVVFASTLAVGLTSMLLLHRGGFPLWRLL